MRPPLKAIPVLFALARNHPRLEECLRKPFGTVLLRSIVFCLARRFNVGFELNGRCSIVLPLLEPVGRFPRKVCSGIATKAYFERRRPRVCRHSAQQRCCLIIALPEVVLGCAAKEKKKKKESHQVAQSYLFSLFGTCHRKHTTSHFSFCAPLMFVKFDLRPALLLQSGLQKQSQKCFDAI